MRRGKKPTRKQKIRLGQAGLAPENWLVVKQKANGELIILNKYYKLCSVVGGSTIYLQKPESVLRPVRDAHIKAEFNGYNHPELARKYGVTERWVRQLCGEGKLEGQMSLLDYGDEPENTTF